MIKKAKKAKNPRGRPLGSKDKKPRRPKPQPIHLYLAWQNNWPYSYYFHIEAPPGSGYRPVARWLAARQKVRKRAYFQQIDPCFATFPAPWTGPARDPYLPKPERAAMRTRKPPARYITLDMNCEWVGNPAEI